MLLLQSPCHPISCFLQYTKTRRGVTNICSGKPSTIIPCYSIQFHQHCKTLRLGFPYHVFFPIIRYTKMNRSVHCILTLYSAFTRIQLSCYNPLKKVDNFVSHTVISLSSDAPLAKHNIYSCNALHNTVLPSRWPERRGSHVSVHCILT